MDNIWFIAAIWMGLALVASLVSTRLGISVALVEILVGVVAGNLPIGDHHILRTTEWTNFLAMLGSGVLTFLAGAEIDPASLRANLRASLWIGVVSFLLPFLGVWAFAQFALGWPMREAWIAGIALSTTSVAVVYAVMIEGGLGATALGKMLLALWVCEPMPRHSDLPGEFEGEAEAADEYFRARREEIAGIAAEHGIPIARKTRKGHAAKTIVRSADEGRFDLIVVGHSDHSELWGRLLGDTADRISDHAPCSVLIVKR